MASIEQKFPHRIFALRERIGLSQDQFAKVLGLTRTTIGFYETGDRRPDISILDKIVELTGCSVEYLMGYTAAMNPAYEQEAMATGLDEDALGAIGECDPHTVGFMVKSKHFEEMIRLMSAISDPKISGNMEEEAFDVYCYRIANHAKQMALDIAKDENMAAVRMAQREHDGHYMDDVKEHEDSLAYMRQAQEDAHSVEQGGASRFLPGFDIDELPPEVLEDAFPQEDASHTPADIKEEVPASKKRGRPKATPDDEIASRLSKFKQKMERRGGEEDGMQAD